MLIQDKHTKHQLRFLFILLDIERLIVLMLKIINPIASITLIEKDNFSNLKRAKNVLQV